jgi:lipopolysaccharide transport system ATP-binding protein
LLEVGTGFHPELTGRENIYLNGAILGMTKAEIRGKLDQIVDFSGCEAYLDTPVKRYSSGMQVRLAFAVAAHLDPEILIVDEVLAVGDAEFQKKCIGRMSEVAGEGRTVLFVSHNLAAVRRLCTCGLTMRNGTTDGIQTMDFALSAYALEAGHSSWEVDVSDQGRLANWGTDARIQRFASLTESPAYGESWVLEMAVQSREDLADVVLSFGFNSLEGSRVMTLDSDLTCPGLNLRAGWNEFRMTLPFNPLHPGPYSVGCSIWKGNLILDALSAVAVWEVHSGAKDSFSYRGFGACRPVVKITIQ